MAPRFKPMSIWERSDIVEHRRLERLQRGRPADIFGKHFYGQRSIWLMNGTTFKPMSIGNAADIVEHRGSSDLHGTARRTFFGKTALLANVSIWIMNGTTYAGSVAFANGADMWSIAARATSTGMGRRTSCQNSSTGERSIWIMNGTTYVGSVALPTEPTGWSIKNY